MSWGCVPFDAGLFDSVGSDGARGGDGVDLLSACRALVFGIGDGDRLVEADGHHDAGAERATQEGEAAAAPRGTSLAEALEAVAAAHEALAAVDLDGETDAAVREAAVAVQRAANRLAGAQLRLLEAVDRREAFRVDGAVTTASWYRSRTRIDPGEASRRVHAAQRLRRLPCLQRALGDGAVTLAHVTAVTEAVVPQRREAIGACDAVLTRLASQASPREVRVAVRRITDVVDAGGSGVEPLPEGPDVRRELGLRPTIDGLHVLSGTLDVLTGERLLGLLDAFSTPDPPGTPFERRRSPGQRRADAFDAVLRTAEAAAAAAGSPTVHGATPHIMAGVDLLDLFGLTEGDGTDLDALAERVAAALAEGDVDDLQALFATLLDDVRPAAGRTVVQRPGGAGAPDPAPTVGSGEAPLASPWLRYSGRVPIELLRRIARDAKVTVVLTMGPWRVTNVGRTKRTLPT